MIGEADILTWFSEFRKKHVKEDFRSLCPFCSYFIPGWTCKAYPKGIPQKFICGDEFHLVKQGDQVGEFIFVKQRGVNG